MDQATRPAFPETSAPARPRPSPLARGLALAGLAALVVFIGVTIQAVWTEWRELQRELSEVRVTAVIGYPGIEPTPSFAARPVAWHRLEGDSLLLWSGWVEGQGHSWFRLTPGDFEPTQLSGAIGRDFTRPIDHAIVESEGGSIWKRVPDEAPVAAGVMAGVATAYPLLVLGKASVVNDTISGKPLLVSYSPFAGPGENVAVFDPVVAGRRLTMGLSGYYHLRRPVLYDRGTESLWVERGDRLEAVSGPHKGTQLPLVLRPKAVPFGLWKAEHPEGRLVVGANRHAPIPEL